MSQDCILKPELSKTALGNGVSSPIGPRGQPTNEALKNSVNEYPSPPLSYLNISSIVSEGKLLNVES